MKCKNCGKEFYNPYVSTDYCSKECEDMKNNITNPFDDIFGGIFKNK